MELLRETVAELLFRAPRGPPLLADIAVPGEDLSQRIDIAVPRGSTRPALRAPRRLHQFDSRTFDLERELLDVGARRPLGLYTAERSIIDAIRLRHREGSDLAWQALRRWLNQPGASPARLAELAQRFPHAEPALRQALAVLL